jgi:Ala-tRNA(Pro) deacylase
MTWLSEFLWQGTAGGLRQVLIMNKLQCLQFLQDHHVEMNVLEHPAVFNMDEMYALHMPGGEQVAKNLFLRDDKKRNFYLVTVPGGRRVDMKQLRHSIGSRPLSFAPESDLERLLGLKEGSVTPLGLLNDREHRVRFYLDASFQNEWIGVHPMENTATVFLQADALFHLLQECGCPAEWLYFLPETSAETGFYASRA